MKKYSLYLVLILTLALSACNWGGPEGAERDEPSPSVPVTGTPPVPMPDYPDVDLVADWPRGMVSMSRGMSITLYEDDETLTAEAAFPVTDIAAIDDYYENVKDDFYRLYSMRAEEAAEDMTPYRLEAGFAVEINRGGILSFSRTLYQYLGGAHGATDIFCETFLVSTGRLLTLDDFFTVGREVYTARMLEYVDAKIDQNPDEFWSDAKQIARELFPYDTFVVTLDGISLLFPEYNIAPYAAGIVRIDVPWGGLAEFFELPG
jgi:hypothetical protein